IELPRTDLQHPEDVGPLLVRDLAAEAIPAQLEQNDVFGGEQVDGLPRLVREDEGNAPPHRLLLERLIRADEDVHLEALARVEDVEAGAVADGLLDRGEADVVIRSETGDQLHLLSRKRLDAEVGVLR